MLTRVYLGGVITRNGSGKPPRVPMEIVNSTSSVIAGLGFGVGQVKLYCGSVPIDFIRENNVILAVQNDGSFAPGVRETLMIVARELGRL